MTTSGWHVSDEELRRYADRRLTPPLFWSTDAHLAHCPGCRERLARTVGPAPVDAGWARLDTALDVPVAGPVERLLLALGVPDHTARLLAATPVLRLSWLAAVASTLGLTVAVANLAEPLVFLAVAPLLPLLGVAVSFGPRADPTYELAVVAPMSTFRLLLLRCAAVLSVTTAVSAVASLGLPQHGPRAIGWFLPALALTLISLVLAPRLGQLGSAVAVAVGWAALLAGTRAPGVGGSSVFSSTGQLAVAVVAALATVALVRTRRALDLPRRFDRAPHAGFRRIT